MADGNSTGPSVTPPVTPADSVIQAGQFPNKLDDVQINLHMMNNHAIKTLVLAFAESVAPPQATIDGIRQNVRDSIEASQSRDPELARFLADRENTAAGEREDIATVRRLNNARESIAQAEAQLEDGITTELQRISDLFAQDADILNARNPNGEQIRAEIARIDGEIAAIVSQLDAIAQQMEVFHVDMVPSDAGRSGLAQTMENSNIPPPSRSVVGYESLYDTWGAALRDSRFHRPYAALLNAAGNLRRQYRALQQSYPTEYKRYQRILGGYNDLDEPIDWANIVSTVVWFIAAEVAFHAAAVALAPITGGVGTAVLYAARMAERAGRLGRLAARGIRSGHAVARWLLNIDRRLWEPFENAFAKAVAKLRERGIIRRGQPGGQVQGQRQNATTGTCSGFRCFNRART